jgi:hypothetical protein
VDNVNDDLPPTFKKHLPPFTLTPYFLYFKAFMDGLKFQNKVKTTDTCMKSIYYAIDDFFYFYNNLTDTTWSTWSGPLLNFTGALSQNFSLSLINCYYFSNETYFYAVIRYAQYDNNFPLFI